MATSVGTIYAEIRATTTTLRADMADAVNITKQGSQAMQRAAADPFQGLRSGSTSATRSITEITRVSKLMSTHLISELSPALGNVAAGTSSVVAGLAKMGPAFNVVTLAIVVATLGLSEYITAVNTAAKSQAAFNIALRSGDIEGLRGQLHTAVQTLEEFAERSEKVGGRIINFFKNLAVSIFGGKTPAEEAARARAGIAQLAPLEQAIALAKGTQALAPVQEQIVEQGRLRAEMDLDEKSFRAYSQALDDLIALQEQAATIIAKTTFDIAKMRAETDKDPAALAKASLELKTALDVAAATAASRRQALRLGTEQRVQGIRADIRGTEQPFGEATPEQAAAITQGMEAINQPMIDLGRSMETIRRQTALMGGEFDSATAKLEATRQAIINFDFNTENATETFAQLNTQFQRLDELVKTQATIRDFTDSLRSGLSSAIGQLLSAQATVAQSFANLGRTIANGLIDSFINKGIKVLERALDQFAKDVQESGLLASLLKLLGVGVQAGASAASAGTGPNIVDVGAPGMAAGGIVRRPMLAYVGEQGPEAVIPLSQLGGGEPQIVINNYSDADVQPRQRTGPDGRQIYEFVISSVKTAVQSGAWDDVMAPYGLRRQAVGR